jgi:multidrug transporter EmrE-like cation transporter
MTVYALVFVLTGAYRKGKKEEKKITQAYAESLIFAILVGAVAPSICLIILKDPQVTAIWQIYPVFMSIADAIHSLIRRPSKLTTSGWTSIQVLLLGVFILSSSLHLATVWPLINEPAKIQQLLIPSIAPLPASVSPALPALDFLQWDYVFGFVSLMFASFWFAQSAIQFFALSVWYIVMTPVAGPGAALTGVFLWRESKLH